MMRPQTFVVVIVAVFVFIARCMADSNGIAGGLSWLIGLLSGFVLVSVWHVCRKFYMDHDGSNLRQLFKEAPPGDRLNAVAIFSLAIAILMAAASVHAQNVATYVPPQAKQYMPMLHDAIEVNWRTVPDRGYIPALIEHESGCFSMPKKCWNPATELLTSREHGVGFSQFTVAYDKQGNVRFDKLAELSEHYPQLRALTWTNVKVRPDLQLVATVLGVRDTFKFFAGVPGALEFTDAAWNGGRGDVQRERRTCKLAADCDPGLWFGHVERFCMKSHSALYGTRSPCDINRFHVRDVWARIPKYRGMV